MEKRGIRNFEKLTNPEGIATAQPKKGRAKELIEERNKLLFYRYYFYARLHRLKYETVLDKLSGEFFISKRTVTILMEQHSLLAKQIFDEKKTIKELQKRYNNLLWKKELSTII